MPTGKESDNLFHLFKKIIVIITNLMSLTTLKLPDRMKTFWFSSFNLH